MKTNERSDSIDLTAGGKAVVAITSAEDGEGIVKVALDTFGGLHILIANAGILRDKVFASMSDKEWDDVVAVHLRSVHIFFFASHYVYYISL